MKKLRLNHDDLRIESFVPSDEGYDQGTVVGRDQEGTRTWNIQDWGCQSYRETCYNTGCGNGLTSTCSVGATECPGQGECGPFSEGYTCFGSCTEIQGCTYCGAIC